MTGSGHPYVVFQRGFTLETWAELEAFIGNELAFSEKLRQAQEVYESVPEVDGRLHLRLVTTRLARLGQSPGR
jgi:hypothetical protein